MICGNWLRLSLGSILKLVKHFKGDEKPLFINPVLGIVLWNSSGTRTEQRAVRAKVWTLLSTKKMRWKFWRILWMLPVGQSIYNGQRNFIRLLWKRKTSITKEEALREIMAYYMTLKNYSELYQPNNGRRTHRCFLLLKSGEECSFGFDSRNRKYICRRCSLCRYQWWCDLSRMQNDCWTHECSFMERWRI